MEHIATTLNKDPTAIRRLNMYKQGQVIFAGPAGGLGVWNTPGKLQSYAFPKKY